MSKWVHSTQYSHFRFANVDCKDISTSDHLFSKHAFGEYM